MKTLFNIILAAIVLNAVVRCGLVARNYFEFEDAAQQAVIFGADMTVKELDAEIRQRAKEHSVPLPDEGLDLRREGARTIAEVSYTDQVEAFPNFKYPVVLSFKVEAQALATGNLRSH
jgi:hypothetical protein